MQANPATRIVIPGMNYQGKGVGFPLGLDSYSHPLMVSELQCRWLENAVTQGAFVQTRPGFKTSLTFDTRDADSVAGEWWKSIARCDEDPTSYECGPVIHPQMCVTFIPSNGQTQIVFAVSGSVFFSLINPDGSLTTPRQIQTFAFDRNADQLVGCRCTQSATIQGGIYANNITPRNLLIIQDGSNRAGIWDGLVGVQANPAKKVIITSTGDTLYPEAWNQTRIGLWMAWSGNRLWLNNGRNVYASDLNDPTHFTEELKLQSSPSFTFNEEVTGMVDRGSSGITRSQVVVFTASTTETLWSGVQNRIPDAQLGKGWINTDDFRVKIFDGVGCVAGKSIIIHRSILYWKSKGGIVLFDSTQTVNSSQNLPPIDQEMAYSKMRIAPGSCDLTCAGKFNNYVWWNAPVGAVTNGRRYCNHQQVLDRQTTTVRSTGLGGAFSAGTTGWQGIWTGLRPIEWTNATVGGQERTYCFSVDAATFAGQAVRTVRIWQAFQANRADNGRRIPWFMETRVHPVQPSIFEYASFKHFRLLMDQILGNLDIVGMWRGLKGNYHELLTTTITATPGSILLPIPQFTPIINSTVHQSFALQGRTVISRNLLEDTNCTAQGVEASQSDSMDHAFSLALRFVGRGAVSGYVIACDSQPSNSEGTAELATGIDETGFNIVPEGACPVHLPGTTPDYIAGEQPIQLGVCPYLPAASLSFDYVAPTS